MVLSSSFASVGWFRFGCRPRYRKASSPPNNTLSRGPSREFHFIKSGKGRWPMRDALYYPQKESIGGGLVVDSTDSWRAELPRLLLLDLSFFGMVWSDARGRRAKRGFLLEISEKKVRGIYSSRSPRTFLLSEIFGVFASWQRQQHARGFLSHSSRPQVLSVGTFRGGHHPQIGPSCRSRTTTRTTTKHRATGRSSSDFERESSHGKQSATKKLSRRERERASHAAAIFWGIGGSAFQD